MFCLAVVTFKVFDLAVFADEETVYAVMLGVLVAAVMNTAACNDDDVTVLSDIEFVRNGLFMSRCRDDDWNAAGLIDRAVLDIDIDTGTVLAGCDLDVGG